mmetsp:Transcript_19872/g.27000  ORF Transcript_19872/g.27000 Transcript_19872/m.27000 type:complete len:83 (-) Transcript_19872:483-731(-)|eukprot:CAMPEP_0185797906 /NCGR_PEP_ID=MMETSP1174-20130828/161866_1 /TAXON_ID=35687 /ORGANISM="Dictyocha speculum, Strain CCMP1381" /LENGTH=82 /DNA_ID=CAMNT_0028493371 /DNA_START=36 /DNA_END=284 /DNA_ORIENTATION=-
MADTGSETTPIRTDGTSEGENGGMLIRMVAVASLGGFLFGYDTGVVSGGILFIENDWNLTYLQEELIVSGTVASAALGCILS